MKNFKVFLTKTQCALFYGLCADAINCSEEIFEINNTVTDDI